MQRWFPGLLLALAWVAPAPAAGLLIPSDTSITPLALVDHHVTVTIDEQVSVTRVEQTFRNHTDRQLEATYVFPVPKGASVNKFTMWVDGKETKGELLEADRARGIYTEIVRRTQDPGLLEYMGNNLLRLRVFPVPAHGDQKVSLSFMAVNACDSGLVEYVYPLKTDGKAAQTLQKFTLDATLKSKHRLSNVYSPTHAVAVKHKGDREAHVTFERRQAVLDKDFQLFYGLGDKDVGLTVLAHRPDRAADGQFLLLLSPRAELGKSQQVQRDMVFVLDTSGSMSGVKMEQARKALKFCLNNLSEGDRFAVLNFATTVNRQADGLTPVSKSSLAGARKWVDALQATGGTAIDAALNAALDLRTKESGRTFTVVFFTDGQPTVGETDPGKIVKSVAARNSADTRIFTFGVGDDVNAVMLDRLAEQTRAVSTYVRPEEDIEVKVSSLYAKISHPVLTDLKLTAGKGVKLSETYPNRLPDLFHGGQVVVLGRYAGKGHVALTLSGKVGGQAREFVYEVDFPAHTGDGKAFVADLWARRKVGFLLDQIRRNGEKKELVEEVVKLAKKHGITTPYTSYLVVPDGQPGAVATTRPGAPVRVPLYLTPPSAPGGPAPGMAYPATASMAAPPALRGSVPASTPPYPTMAMNAPAPHGAAGGAPMAGPVIAYAPAATGYAIQTEAPGLERGARLDSDPQLYEQIRQEGQMRNALARGEAQAGKLGVDLAVQLQELRSQDRLSAVASRQAQGRTCRQIGGAWVDEGYDAKMPKVTLKAQGKAYFRMLERQPLVKEVFQLGNRVVWVTPSGTVLVIDPKDGKDELSDEVIDKLFVARK